MAAVTILSHEDCLEILQRWKRDGPTQEEKDEFTLTALAQLNDHNEVNLIQEDISQAAEMAESIDKIFTEVQKQFLLLSMFFVPFLVLLIEWTGYKEVKYPCFLQYASLTSWFTKRWRQCLRRSCDVAAENIDILRRIYSFEIF